MLRVDVFEGYRFNLVGYGFVLVGYSLCLLGMGMSLCWGMFFFGFFWGGGGVQFVLVVYGYVSLLEYGFVLVTFLLGTYLFLWSILVYVGCRFVFSCVHVCFVWLPIFYMDLGLFLLGTGLFFFGGGGTSVKAKTLSVNHLIYSFFGKK